MIGLSFLTNYEKLIFNANPELIKDFALSFSATEYKSSKWLVETLRLQRKAFDNVAILGSSFSTYLVPMLCTVTNCKNIVLYDKNEERLSAATTLHTNIREGTNIHAYIGDLESLANDISKSSYDLIIVPYADKVPELAQIRVASSKALYVVQATVGNRIKNETDLILSSGCIQQSFRGVENMGNGCSKVMIIGRKALHK